MRTIKQLARVLTGLSVLAAASIGCSGGDGPSQFNLSERAEEKYIRAPDQQHVVDHFENGYGSDVAIIMEPEVEYDSRRDVFEDEDPGIGEDPRYWDQTSESHQKLHGSRPVRLYGYQWLRSYARNSVVALFNESDFEAGPDGTRRLKELREQPERVAERALAATGWDICPEQRFAGQMTGNRVADAICGGVLIDRNLVLTAAHCVRDELMNPIEDVDQLRVVFSYAATDPSKQNAGAHDFAFTPGHDIFQIKELLTFYRPTADFAILELRNYSDGAPISGTDPSFVPVPLWTSGPPESAVTDRYQYRPGAAVGPGLHLPLKISVSRSKGWQTDPTFLGISFSGEIYGGNSGGPFFDIETGALLGVLHAQMVPQLKVVCPDDRSTTTWPVCTPTGPKEPKLIPLTLVPAYTYDEDVPTWRRCLRYADASWLESPEASDYLPAMMQQVFNVEAKVAGLGDSTYSDKLKEHALVTSIHAIRRLACDTANSPKPFEEAAWEEAEEVVADAEDAGNAPECEDSENPTPWEAYKFCPSGLTGNYTPDPARTALFVSYLADPSPILRESLLCKGTVPDATVAEWSDLPELKLEYGRETTYHGTTANGHDYFESPLDHAGFANPDALYRIKTDRWTILYADTFSGGIDLDETSPGTNPGTNFDTGLVLLEEVDSDSELLVPSEWNQSAVFDDSGCAAEADDVGFAKQTQLVHPLAPNKKYILMVTGWNSDFGEFNLHVQSVPGARNGTILAPPEDTPPENWYHEFVGDSFLPPGASEEHCLEIDPNGEFDPLCVYNTAGMTTCQQGDSGDYILVATSCPEFNDSRFWFMGGGLGAPDGPYTDDPVATVWQGNALQSDEGYVCADDTFLNFWFWTGQSYAPQVGSADQVIGESVETLLSSGAAVRAFYLQQFRDFLDWSSLTYTLWLPKDAVNLPQ